MLIDGNSFFGTTDEDTSDVVPEVTKIKVGDQEFTQDELNDLVGLGKIAKDAEERYNTKIDRVFPEFTKKTQELAVLKKEKEDRERADIASKLNQGAELTPDEKRRAVISEARQFGLLTEEDVDDRIEKRLAAKEILGDINVIVKDAEAKGIRTDAQTIADHMVREGFRNPQKAFKDLYETQLNAWEKTKLNEIKPPGLMSEPASTAGGKTPSTEKVTLDNLLSRVTEVLNSGS